MTRKIVDSKKWASRLISGVTNNQEKIVDGINSVDQAPGMKAAKQADKWLAKIQASKAKWATNVAGVSLEEWKKKTIEKGVPRIVSGLEASRGKIEDFAEQFGAHLQAGQSKIDAMPTTTFDQNLAKMVAQARHNKSFVLKK